MSPPGATPLHRLCWRVYRTDRISMLFTGWCFNLRLSNTEPVVRLNVESGGDIPLMEERMNQNQCIVNPCVQYFSDISIMFGGLWFICEVSKLSFLYMHLLVALITLVVFLILGRMTDFYRF